MAGLGTSGERGPPASVPDALPDQHRLHLSVAQPELPALDSSSQTLLEGEGEGEGQGLGFGESDPSSATSSLCDLDVSLASLSLSVYFGNPTSCGPRDRLTAYVLTAWHRCSALGLCCYRCPCVTLSFTPPFSCAFRLRSEGWPSP